MTFDGYGHFFPDTNREVARRLDETLFGGKADRSGDFGKNLGHILASEPTETVMNYQEPSLTLQSRNYRLAITI